MVILPFPRLTAVLALLAGAAFAVGAPAQAQSPASAPSQGAAVPASPLAVQSGAASATRSGQSALGSIKTERPKADGAKTVACKSPPDLARFDYPLTRTARKLAGGEPIKMVAIGSSSTAGAGASSPAGSYPSQLAIELSRKFPDHEIVVLNRGVGGEVAADMLARFESDVISERPDLVIWQVGTNSVLRDQPLGPHLHLLRDGLRRLKASGADVVLIDPQFAPKVIHKADTEGMVALIATVAKETHVDLFRRFALMRHWRETQGIPFETFVSSDGLHLNDWSYACIARALADAIGEASTRAPMVARTPTAVSGQQR
jgi:lysophospholipase L1-like esterase